jgi:hypothetical protein
MITELEDKLLSVLEAYDGSLSLQVAAVLRLTNQRNIKQVMEVLPESFKPDFLSWCRKLAPPGSGISIGRFEGSPDEGIVAICEWLKQERQES